VVTVSASSGIQAVLTEHAELHSSGPMPTLKLFLQPRIAVASPEDSSYPYSPPFNPPNYKLNLSNLNGSHGNGSFYNSSPRTHDGVNGMNGHGNGHGNGTPRRSSSKLSTPLLIENGHPNKPSLELDMNFINNAALDAENTPPFRTPPRSPPSSPRNPLRTPPGSPKGKYFPLLGSRLVLAKDPYDHFGSLFNIQSLA
jgi:hypothetical protein